MAKGKQTRKCQHCGIDDTHMDEMEFVTVGEKRPIKKFYHKSCFKKYLKKQEFLDNEKKELDKLDKVIKEIYGVKVMPNTAYSLLQDLRNGNKFFGKENYRYKEGYTYDLIAETFDYCSETIEYHNSTKSFNGFMGAFRYGLAIVCDKLMVVEKRRQHRENQDKMIEKHIEQLQEKEISFESNYKKPSKNKGDFSDFLDD